MDTIVTPVTVITLDSTRIVHSIKADLVARYFPPVVRLVQYDQSLPVIAVSLMQNGQTYTLPSGAAANIRVHKPDATYVYNPALGCDSTRNIVYFEVTQAMAAANGDGLAIVEIVVDGDIAGTSLITLHFEENPVPEDAIESSDEWETIYELGERIIASTVTPVSTAAGMTDHDVVYLYTGLESGWNQGHMYYYNGTTWVDAGIAVTDTTLSVAGLAADAKKTGDEIADLKDGLTAVESDVTDLKEDLNYGKTATAGYILTATNNGHGSTWSPVGLPTDEQTAEAVTAWLNAHPEATTTVADHSLTYQKLVNGTLGFVTPQMFGAKADGITDDTTAIQNAINTGNNLYFPNGTYCVSGQVSINSVSAITSARRAIYLNENAVIKAISDIDSVFTITGNAEGVVIDGGIIDCNNKAKEGIHFIFAIGAYIRNMYIKNAKNACINLVEGHHSWVVNCKLYNPLTFATGIKTAVHDTKVVGCEIYYTSKAIELLVDMIIITATHLWSGGRSNDDQYSKGIVATSSSPRIICTTTYFDSFFAGIDCGNNKAIVKLSSCNFFIAGSATPEICYGVVSESLSTECEFNSCDQFCASEKTLIPIRKNSINIYVSSGIDRLYGDRISDRKIIEYADTLTKGFYTASSLLQDSATTDAPTNDEHWFYDILVYSSNTIKIIAYSYNTSNISVRLKNGGVWGSWTSASNVDKNYTVTWTHGENYNNLTVVHSKGDLLEAQLMFKVTGVQTDSNYWIKIMSFDKGVYGLPRAVLYNSTKNSFVSARLEQVTSGQTSLYLNPATPVAINDLIYGTITTCISN